MSDYCINKPKNYYGKIDYLYQNKLGNTDIGETLYYKSKKAFEKEIKDSNEIGRPIGITLKQEIEKEIEWIML